MNSLQSIYTKEIRKKKNSSKLTFPKGLILMNSLGKVPVIQDGDFCLSETNTILRYLANSFEVEDHWYPKDSIKRFRVDMFFDW